MAIYYEKLEKEAAEKLLKDFGKILYSGSSLLEDLRTDYIFSLLNPEE